MSFQAFNLPVLDVIFHIPISTAVLHMLKSYPVL